jgi:pimeloyl-ACP methyl ester carboxylesterase
MMNSKTVIEEQRFKAGEFDIRALIAGSADAPPIVLLHGGGTDSAMLTWRETIPALAASYRVIAPDWPGYGESADFPGEYSQEGLLHCLGAMLDAWQPDHVTLAGLSMGSGAALGYALDHPERVSRLVLVGSYGLQDRVAAHRLSYLYIQMPFLVNWSWDMIRGSRSMIRWTLKSLLKNPASLTDAMVDEVHEIARSSKSQQAFYAFQRSEMLPDRMRSNYMGRLGEITCPTLIVHGEDDAGVPVRYARQAAEHIPGARLAVLPDCGHWVPRDHPETFNTILCDFLKETE